MESSKLINYSIHMYQSHQGTMVTYDNLEWNNSSLSWFQFMDLWPKNGVWIYQGVKTYISPKVRFGHPLQDFTFV
jgi:hypothetical protein